MAQATKVHEFSFGGLVTKPSSTGLQPLDLIALQDARIVGTDLVQRLGTVRVAQVTGNMSAVDFDGVNEHYSNAVDTRPWTLGLYWTVEFLMEPDDTDAQGIICVGSTTPAIIFDITSTNIRCRVWDSAGTSTTITVGAAAASVQSVQLTRSTSTLTTRLNNGSAVTGSMSATLNCRTPVGDLRVGRDDGTAYMDGTFDYLRALSIVKSNHNDRLVRLPCPRAEYVLADYDFQESAANLAYDRSRYEAHLIAQNTPAEIATLCHNPAPVRVVSMMPDENDRKSLLVVAGGKYYNSAADA